MPSDRLTGFSSAFDELLERNRRELDALSGSTGSRALSPTSPTSASPSAGSVAATARIARQGDPSLATERPLHRPRLDRPRNARSTKSSAWTGATRSWTGPARAVSWSCDAA